MEDAVLKEEFEGLDPSKIQITTNKWFNNREIEVDVLVEINPGSTYSSIFLFECKDWKKKKVGIGVIRDLRTKIKDLKAQKGFIVAPKFTRDAIKSAEKHNIELMVLDKNTDVLSKMPTAQYHEVLRSDLLFFFDGKLCKNPKKWGGAIFPQLGGKTLLGHLDEMDKKKLFEGALKHIEQTYKGDRIYRVINTIFYAEGQFTDTSENESYSKLEVKLMYQIWLSKAKYIYDYYFSSKGKRIMKQVVINAQGQTIPLFMIEKDNKIPPLTFE